MSSSVPTASWRNKVLKDTAMLNAATLTSQIAALAQSLIVMRLLEPSVYGIWMGLTILLTYGGFSHLGSEHGIELRVPYFRGKGQHRRIAALSDSVFLVWTLTALVLSAAIAVFAVVSQRPPLVKEGLLAIALILPLNQQSNFYSRWHGAALTDFRSSSILSVAQSWISLVVMVPLVLFFRLRGVMIGAVIVAAAVYGGWLSVSSYRFRGRWSRTLYWEALRVGLPMTVVVLAGGLIQTVDRVVILGTLGTTSLGYYGVTTFGGAIIYGLMSHAGSAMSPHITAEMGRSGDSPAALKGFLVTPTIAFSYIATFAVAALMVVIPALVAVWLPKYAPGLTAFIIYVPGFYFLGVILTANTILTLVLIARRRQRVVLYVQAIVIAIEGGLAFVLIKGGWGLEGAAFASTIAYTFYGITILIMASRTVFVSRAEVTAFLSAVITPFAVVIPIMMLAHFVAVPVFGDRTAVAMLAKTVVLAIVVGLLWPGLNRRVAMRPLALQVRNAVATRLRARG